MGLGDTKANRHDCTLSDESKGSRNCAESTIAEVVDRASIHRNI